MGLLSIQAIRRILGMHFNELSAILYGLLEDNPIIAIQEANKLDDSQKLQLLRAAILIDAGAAIGSHDDVLKGVEIMERAVNAKPDEQTNKYNLANGYHALAMTTKMECPQWYSSTYHYRLKARKLFYDVAINPNALTEIQTQAFTNLGNLLWSSYRWVEAYDVYRQALSVNSQNGVASAGALKILRYAYSIHIGDKDLLANEIESLATHVRENIDVISKYSGIGVVQGILEEIKDIPNGAISKKFSPQDEFEKFVLAHSLTLSPTIHRNKHDKKRWDELTIYSVVIPNRNVHQIPEVYAMFNVMKADYILARKVLFDGINKNFEDTGTYADTLNYANYGIQSSMLTLAQRASLDVLDKIAVATLAFLDVKNARKASFKTAWYKPKKSKVRAYLSEVEGEIEKGNTALLAIVEIANDLSEAMGFLKAKQDTRNSSTHRFTVLHDFTVNLDTSSECLEHKDQQHFISESIETLQLARSALVYFVQMIDIFCCRFEEEHEGLIATLEVPSHEFIRHGENGNELKD